jgi:hypothetical protein
VQVRWGCALRRRGRRRRTAGRTKATQTDPGSYMQIFGLRLPTRGSFARTRSDTKMLRQGEVAGGRRRRPCRSRPPSNPRAQPSPPDTLTRCVRSWPGMLPAARPPLRHCLPAVPVLASSGTAAWPRRCERVRSSIPS